MLKAIRPDHTGWVALSGQQNPRSFTTDFVGHLRLEPRNLQIFGPSLWLFMIALHTCAVRDCERSLSVVVGLA